MSRRLYVVTVVIVKPGEDVMDGIVEPGVADCDVVEIGAGAEARAAASGAYVNSVLKERG